MIIAMVSYTNKYGRVDVKGFATETALKKFLDALDARGAEYILTRLDNK